MLRRTILLAALVLSGISCGGGGDQGRFAFTLSLVGLPDSSTIRGHYEGWAVINGVAFSTGAFVVDGVGPDAIVRAPNRLGSFGTAAAAVFGPSSTLLGTGFPFINKASHLFITIEPDGDHDLTPSCQVILAGAISNQSATLLPTGVAVPVGFPCAVADGLGGARLGLPDLSQAVGVFEMRSPTNDLSNPTPDDQAGVWFTDSSGGPPVAGLSLPTLPGTFGYEAFAVVDGETRSLGKFLDPADRDDDFAVASQRGDDSPGPDFPGGDFVQPFTPSLAFDPPAIDLASAQLFASGDWRAFICVEPVPDNDRASFGLEILTAFIPPTAVSAGEFSTGDVAMSSLFPSLPTASLASATTSVTVTGLGLPALGSATTDRRGHYELFATIAGMPVSLDRFVVAGNVWFSLESGAAIGTTAATVLDAVSTANPAFPDTTLASEFYVTFEREGDDDGLPSGSVVLQGNAGGASVLLTVAGATASGGRGLASFSAIAGFFHLRTPTDDFDGVPVDDRFGILYRRRNVARDRDANGLTLPVLPAGWIYEGFVEERATGLRYSTGRFRDPGASDLDDGESNSRDFAEKPGFPGEDFLYDVPTMARAAAMSGSISQVFVTVEPVPDSSLEPSFLRVLQATVPAGAVVGGVGQGPVPLTNVSATSLSYSGFMTFQPQH